MKKMSVCMVAVIATMFGMAAYNDVKANSAVELVAEAVAEAPTSFTIPQWMQEKAYEFALKHNLLPECDVRAMQETNCLQRGLNAFLANWEPADAVNEVAKCAVESKKYKSVDAAKKAIKGDIERVRHNSKNWAILYELLGL